MAAGCSASAIAQKTNTHNHADSLSSRWVIDINLLGGMASQSLTTANSMGNYPGAVSSNIGELKYNKGYSFGADAQLGVFFGRKRHFGLGAGIMFMEQHGEATLTGFRVDSRATDAAGNVYRQMLTGYDVKEKITSSIVNVPVVIKYKNRFSKHWGFTADAGALINVKMHNSYVTNASFDQEAAYKFVQNSDGRTTSVYDNGATPSPDDWLITRAEFLRNNPNGSWQDYTATKRAMGINVGDRLITNSRTGGSSYKTGSVGFILQPSFSYYLSDNAALNFGAYYMMQPFKGNPQGGYRLTDGNGSYSSVLNNVTEATNHAYGVNVGARFFLGRHDRDHDGVADKKDECPDVFGLAKFYGCPDTDNDGVVDYKDSCATVWGLALYNGCPDTDGDGLQDKVDECPYAAGPRELNGCPDRDKDGILDKNDACPDVFGIALYHGCPDTDGDGLPDNEDKCPTVAGPVSNQGCPPPVIENTHEKGDLNTPILFEVNLSEIKRSSLPGIEDAVEKLNEDRNATLTIDGHADASGPEEFNEELSRDRANAVKSELTQRGINGNRVRTMGHGSNIPAATNATYEGKQQNRRAQMKLKSDRR